MCDSFKSFLALISNLDNKNKFGKHWALPSKIWLINKLKIKSIVKAHDNACILQHGCWTLTSVTNWDRYKTLLNCI